MYAKRKRNVTEIDSLTVFSVETSDGRKYMYRVRKLHIIISSQRFKITLKSRETLQQWLTMLEDRPKVIINRKETIKVIILKKKSFLSSVRPFIRRNIFPNRGHSIIYELCCHVTFLRDLDSTVLIVKDYCSFCGGEPMVHLSSNFYQRHSFPSS